LKLKAAYRDYKDRICYNTAASKVGYFTGNIWILLQYMNILNHRNSKPMVSYFERVINTAKYSKICGKNTTDFMLLKRQKTMAKLRGYVTHH
jgi:hypothetical protein